MHLENAGAMLREPDAKHVVRHGVVAVTDGDELTRGAELAH